MSEIHDVVKRVCLRQKGGISGVASRIGANPNTLTHKLAEQSGHNLFASEVEAVALDAPQDPELAQYFARLCNHVCIPVLPRLADAELGKDIVAVGKEFGDLMAATQEAIADGRVTSRELAEFDCQFMELISAAAALRADLKKRIPAAPPELKVAK